jgi:hypothetical protein
MWSRSYAALSDARRESDLIDRLREGAE